MVSLYWLVQTQISIVLYDARVVWHWIQHLTFNPTFHMICSEWLCNIVKYKTHFPILEHLHTSTWITRTKQRRRIWHLNPLISNLTAVSVKMSSWQNPNYKITTRSSIPKVATCARSATATMTTQGISLHVKSVQKITNTNHLWNATWK
jgi:hypothetical protein